MNATDLREQLASLRESGVALRARDPGDVIDALAAVLDRWRDAESPERAQLERELPAVAGFSPPNVKEGLALALAAWDGNMLRAEVNQALPRRGSHGYDTTGVILGGSIPMPTLLSIVEPLALRSAVLAKTASRDPRTAHLVARSISAVDPALGACVAVVDLPSADDETMDVFLEADLIVATGSDETVDAVERRVRPPRRVVKHGHRLSIAALGTAAVGERLGRAARGIALDTALWDQLGCLSPVVVFAPRESCEEVGAALAESLAQVERRLPRGTVAPDVEALHMHERSGAELRNAAGGTVVVHSGEGGAWTVIVEDSATPRAMPLHRFLRVHPFDGSPGLHAALGPYLPHLAGAAVDGFPDDGFEFFEQLARQGARICLPGELQTPPLYWSRDGVPLFSALLRPE